MKAKRKPRTYKIKDTQYRKAKRRAKSENTNVANVVEHTVEMYGEGATCVFFEFTPKKPQ